MQWRIINEGSEIEKDRKVTLKSGMYKNSALLTNANAKRTCRDHFQNTRTRKSYKVLELNANQKVGFLYTLASDTPCSDNLSIFFEKFTQFNDEIVYYSEAKKANFVNFF